MNTGQEVSAPASLAQRWLAHLVVAVAAAAVLVLVGLAGLKSIALVGVGLAGLAITAAGLHLYAHKGYISGG